MKSCVKRGTGRVQVPNSRAPARVHRAHDQIRFLDVCSPELSSRGNVPALRWMCDTSLYTTTTTNTTHHVVRPRSSRSLETRLLERGWISGPKLMSLLGGRRCYVDSFRNLACIYRPGYPLGRHLSLLRNATALSNGTMLLLQVSLAG